MTDEVKQSAEKERFLTELQRVPKVPEWLGSIRGESAERFAELSFPHRKMEDWRFTNVNPIVRTPFRSLLSPTAHAVSNEEIAVFRFGSGEWTELVFVDGFFAESISTMRTDVRAGSLARLARADDSVVSKYLNRQMNGSSTVFTTLNSAFLLDGAFVHIAKNARPDAPIHLLFVTTGSQPESAMYPRTLVIADSNSESTIVESYVHLDAEAVYFNNAVTEVIVGDGARMNWIKLLNEGPRGYHLSSARVHQGRDSAFRSFSIFQNGNIARNDLQISLKGEGSDASLNGLYMIDGEQLVDNAVAIDHAQPNCTSWIEYKGVLDDQSHGVFSGKIYVHRGAQKTDSKQLNRNMLLSDKATVDTKPLLEIFADDVKCTHGATVGPPPHELVYYFQTRGLSRAQALAMLTYGFVDEIISKIDVSDVRERLEAFAFAKYSPIPN